MNVDYVGKELLEAKLEIETKNTMFGHLDGQLSEEFRWSLEFNRFGSDDLVLCLKHWILENGARKMVAAIGPVVSMCMGGRGFVTLLLEDHEIKKWVTVSLPAKKFSGT